MDKSFHFLVCGIRMAKNRWGKMPVKVDSWTFQKKREREKGLQYNISVILWKETIKIKQTFVKKAQVHFNKVMNLKNYF